MKKLNFQLLMSLFILSIIVLPNIVHAKSFVRACSNNFPVRDKFGFKHCIAKQHDFTQVEFDSVVEFYSTKEVDNNIEKKFKELSTFVGNKLDNLNGDLKDQASKEFLPKTENLQTQIDDLKKQIEDLKSQISNLKKKE